MNETPQDFTFPLVTKEEQAKAATEVAVADMLAQLEQAVNDSGRKRKLAPVAVSLAISVGFVAAIFLGAWVAIPMAALFAIAATSTALS